MGFGRFGSARRARGSIGVCALAAALVAGTLVFARHVPTAAAPGPALVVDAPARATVGQVITVTISVNHASDLAGYEMTLAYDPAAAHLNDLQQRQNDIKKLGRDVQAVGPAQLADGVSFGAFSCPVDACAQPLGNARRDNGANGKVTLGVAKLVADRAGTLTIAYGQSRFVDATGAALPVELGAGTLVIQVDGGQ